MNKDMFAKMGMFSLLFIVLLYFISDFSSFWYTIDYTLTESTPDMESLSLMWTTVITATLIQGFVLFAALLGANLQFTPVEEH